MLFLTGIMDKLSDLKKKIYTLELDVLSLFPDFSLHADENLPLFSKKIKNSIL